MDEQEPLVKREKAIDLFLNAVKKCPHVIKEGIGAEQFAQEIIKGAMKLYQFMHPMDNFIFPNTA